MIDAKEPIDLPDPVCEKHDNPTFPCPDCARADKLENRLVFIVPAVILIATAIYLWIAHR